MRTVRIVLGLASLAMLLSAHPMGNFSVNHYAKIQLEPNGAKILFVLDLAEIPTFELMQKWGLTAAAPRAQLKAKAIKEARDWSKQLTITVDGTRRTLQFEGAEMAITDGAGGLPVMRVSTKLNAPGAPGILKYSDGTYPDRTAGWKEVSVIAEGGAGIKKSTAGSNDISRGLTAYPQDATLAPPQDLTATVTWVAEPVNAPVIGENKVKVVEPAPEPVPMATAPTVSEPNSMGQVKRNDFLSRALKGGEIGWGLALTCVAVAFWFGALHAIEPGHGKTMVAAYLVGSKGTMKHALFLGGMVTFTHTVSVFLLGLVTLFLSQYIMPDKISKVLGVISGLTIVYLGGMLLYRRSIGMNMGRGHHHDHDHAHSHSHGGLPHTHDGNTHSHVPEGNVSVKSLVALGASGGLVPCPSALVLLLSAISIGRTGFGLLLLVSFSLGLALVLMAMGLVVVYAKNLFPERRSEKPNPLFAIMPVVSAAIILLVGIVLTGNSLGVIPVMRFFG